MKPSLERRIVRRPRRAPLRPTARTMALGQGLFFLGAGAWPLVHMPSFETVTGPKEARWLVRTVGSLITVIGAGLFLAGRRNRVTRELRLIGAGSCATLGTISLIYAARRRISPIYLLDTAAEYALLTGWLLAEAEARREASRRRRSEPPPAPAAQATDEAAEEASRLALNRPPIHFDR